MLNLLIESSDPLLDHYTKDFCQFMGSVLGLQELPHISFVGKTGQASFGHYHPSTGEVVVATEGRHIADILRTVGHEYVHARQMEMGEIDNLPLIVLERDANAVVGLAMREYNKLHPELYSAETIEGPPGTLGDTQGAVAQDPTRPTGPIELAELSDRTLISYKNKAKGEIHSVAGQTSFTKHFHRQFHKGQDLNAVRKKGLDRAEGKLKHRLTHDYFREEAPVNSAGSGDIAGIGIGPDGEPGVRPRKKPIIAKMLTRKTFKKFKREITEAPKRTEAEEKARKELIKRMEKRRVP